VDAGVGAAGALGQGGFAGDVVNGAGECALDGGEIGLDLPAVVGSSVVSESELPVEHGADLDGITRECLTRMGTDGTDLKTITQSKAVRFAIPAEKPVEMMVLSGP
jgi:hypothetical protein